MSNYADMGLDYGIGLNAFTSLRPRSTVQGECTPPAKRGPKSAQKLKQPVDSSLTFEERQAAREAKVLRDNRSIHFTISPTPQSDRDKTSKIIGRSNATRTQ